MTTPEGSCWLWSGTQDRNGYGKLRRLGKTYAAHRFVYEQLVGPVPAGLELDHLCRNRECVNPAHLQPVHHGENMRRGYWARRTHCKHGHEYTPDNTRLYRGKRICRTCSRERVR